MKKGTNYFNFPIALLDGLFEDKKSVLLNIRCYALFAHAEKLHKKDDEEYNFLESAKFFEVSNDWSEREKKQYFETGKILFSSIDENSPKVGLNIDIWKDYFKNHKSEFDLACLAAFLAIKSILGPNKAYCRLTNLFLWSRMNGYSNTVEDCSELSPCIAKYAAEYQTKKIKDALKIDWSLTLYGINTRGFFVSFKLNKEELAMQVEKSKKSNKLKEYNHQIKNARNKALAELKRQYSDNLAPI